MKAPYNITLRVTLNDGRKRFNEFNVRSMVGPEIDDNILTEPSEVAARTVELDIDPSVLAGRTIEEVLQSIASLGYRLRKEKEEEERKARQFHPANTKTEQQP